MARLRSENDMLNKIRLALVDLGGQAKLQEIYDKVSELNPNIKDNFGHKGHTEKEDSYRASIRRTIEINSSDSEAFNGIDIFKSIYGKGKGVWGLRDFVSIEGSNDNIINNDLKNIKVIVDEIVDTETIYEIKVRKVQSKFRNKLIKRYKNQCPLTGITMTSFLVASHIKPWKDSNHDERLDENNGILLCVHLDNLFDKGQISFDDEGVIICKNQTIVKLLKENFKIVSTKLKVTEAMKEYLKWHRTNFEFDSVSMNYIPFTGD